jgi:DNA primase large subunit
LKDFADKAGIVWKYVSPYSAQASGKVERFVGTLKRSILRYITSENVKSWDKKIPSILYGYLRKRQAECRSPFEKFYGAKPRLTVVDPVSFIDEPTEAHRQIELLAYRAARASRRTSIINQEENRFKVGDQVLIVHGPALCLAKWKALVSKW